MSEIKYKGIDFAIIEEIENGFIKSKMECCVFDRKKLEESLQEDGVMGKVLDAIRKQEQKEWEATEMYCICEMAKLWLKHCRDMQEIVERLEEERTLLKQERKEAIEYDDEQIIFATNNQIRAFDYSIRVVKEVGGMNG